jgi:peptide/nickel transport system permease protein
MRTGVAARGTAVHAAQAPALRKRRIRLRPTAVVGLAVLGVIFFCALFAPWVAPFDPNAQDVTLRLIPPFQPDSPFILGTDHVGRDVLSRLIHGARVAWLIGASAVLLSGVVGVILGLISGYYGGLIDDFISWLANVELAFPFILLAIVVAAILGAGLFNLILVLAVVSWVVYARVVRGETLVQREQEFVHAARALGASNTRILFRHVLPNVLTPVIVIATFEFSRMIISEASLSFLGLGVQPAIPSWGSMLADGRQYLATAWWVATLPGLGITVTVLAINLVGDWLRDQLDPRLNA